MMFLPEKIKEMRESLGMTQEELMIALANEGVRVSLPTLGKWEAGTSKPDVDDLVALRIVFNKPLKYFFAL
jgi:DNA-binding transcriptional regulator YiaG